MITEKSLSQSKQSTQTDEIKTLEHVPMIFAHITRGNDVRFFTGITGPELFKEIFNIMLEPKAKHMTYWSGVKAASGSDDLTFSCDQKRLNKRGPSRKLTLEQKLLMVMVRLRLGLLMKDLAFCFLCVR